jgi:hypothetical protein
LRFGSVSGPGRTRCGGFGWENHQTDGIFMRRTCLNFLLDDVLAINLHWEMFFFVDFQWPSLITGGYTLWPTIRVCCRKSFRERWIFWIMEGGPKNP